jgi:RimK-like ATP-grasp domain
MAKQRVNGKLWVGPIVNGKFVPKRLARRLPGGVPLRVPVPPREVPKRVVKVIPRLPDGNYIIRKRGGGKESTDAITGQSLTGLRVFREDVQARLGGRQTPREIGFLFRWGFCGPTPPAKTIVNEVGAIGLTSDKGRFRWKLDEAKLCPKMFKEVKGADFPVVVRPGRHEQGVHVYKCDTPVQLQAALRACGAGAYISSYIPKVKEYRVFVCQGRVGWVAEKIPGANPGVSWNHAQGSHFENRRFDAWPLRSLKASVEAFNLSGLDFGAVDVMEDAKGKAYVLEINTAMALESEYRATCTARCFDYITKNGKGKIPLIEKKGGYKKFIHPAVNGEALV